MRKYTIVLDPGHGYHRGEGRGKQDPGAVAYGKEEEHYAHEVAAMASRILEARGPFTAYLTRGNHWRSLKPYYHNPTRSGTNDALYWRRTVARDVRAEVFISIHWNAFILSSARGTETFHRPDSSASSGRLAYAVQRSAMGCLNHYAAAKQVPNWTPRDRGVKKASFGVLSTHCPSCLFECEFLTNPQVNKLMDDKDFIWTLGNSVAIGVLAYFGIKPT